jgi:hypothetical protein
LEAVIENGFVELGAQKVFLETSGGVMDIMGVRVDEVEGKL